MATDRRDGHRLDPRLVEVDLWELYAALGDRRRPEAGSTTALAAIATSCTGPFAADLQSHWAGVVRASLRLEAADTLDALSRSAPDQAGDYVLDRLAGACAADLENQALCRVAMRTQARLNRHDDIPRTLDLLSARLARRRGVPEPQTVDLARRLAGCGPG